MVLPPRPDRDTRPKAEKTVSLEAYPVDREAPTLPPEQGADEEAEIVTETSPLGAQKKQWAPPQLDSDTRELISDTIAKAIAAELGRAHVQIASIAPPASTLAPAPRSSLRAAAKGAGKVGKWGVFVSGALSLLGSFIVLIRPEYAAPMAQAVKLIAALIMAAAGGGAPAADAAPARDVPPLVTPAPATVTDTERAP